MSDRRAAWALEIGPDGSGTTTRLWSGPGTLTLNSEEYSPVDGAEISDLVLDGSAPEVNAVLPILEGTREAWLTWDGSVPAVFRYLRLDGAAWTQLGPRIVGMVTDPAFSRLQGVEVVGITVRAQPQLTPAPRVWSGEAQAARFPGDRALQQLRGSVERGLSWPR